MKLLKISSFYPDYVKRFYENNPDLGNKSYQEQIDFVLYDEFGWGDFWTHALSKIGYETKELIINIEPMQRMWAKENGINDNSSLENVTIGQIKNFKPDILWFDLVNPELLKNILSEIKSIKLTLGACGSFVPKTEQWQNIDIVLSGALETVDFFNNQGINCKLLSYAFDERILSRLEERKKKYDVSFMGQIVRGTEFHLQREKMLEMLSSKIKLQIFSSSANYSVMDDFKQTIWKYIYKTFKSMKQLGIKEESIRNIPFIGKAITWENEPFPPVSLKLLKLMKPAVYGLEMFQAIKDSKICLNIHADSSPKFASNMRLFEITGTGSCMVTDWKKNIGEFF